ncbi:MAG: nucleotidyl transferase AbiEii/AbiGii toxin family protein [Myxococcales bacterium]|nr:nucleotidyl transferase AbiEii/AbiGii toxin family protein [Myxococcales bacterium]
MRVGAGWRETRALAQADRRTLQQRLGRGRAIGRRDHRGAGLRYHRDVDLLAEVVAVTAALDAAAIEYAICGGVALAIHGAPRATRDIDLMARGADLARLRTTVRGCGFTVEALPMTFQATGVSIRRFTKLAADHSALMLDVLLADGALDEVWRTRTQVAFTSDDAVARSLWVVSRAGLITLKLAAARPQDLVDVQRLEEVARGEPDA